MSAEAPTVRADMERMLTQAWATRGIDPGKVRFERGTAVAPTALPAADAREQTRTLPPLLVPAAAGQPPQFCLGEPLGEGGMGVVWLAEQTSLRRQVAVKSLKRGVDIRSAAPQLLREARVTGALEHPNVVPIYEVGRDDQDRPLIVMKRIEGRAWSDILAEVPDGERRSDAFVRRQIDLLEQLAQAVQFAHSKGVIHRDLKPDNVMLGPFGELYLVDWGIAVSLRPDGIEGLPLARDVNVITGTPQYMAPEMAAGDGPSIDERTDVYLLGAILHEILTGEPPHQGETLTAVLSAAFASTPARYPDWVPTDLVAIAHRAMSQLPDDRYVSAANLAEALDLFQYHRASTDLSETAARRLAELSTSLGEAESGDRSQFLHRLFSECRFGFRQALRSWDGNVAARAGLQRTLELMISFELSRDAPDAARALVPELPVPDPELEAHIDAALRDKHLAAQRLARLDRDADVTFAALARRQVARLVGALWGLTCLVCGWLTRAGSRPVSTREFALLISLLFLAVAASIAVTRRDTLANAVNRRVVTHTLTLYFTYVVLWAGASFLGVEPTQTMLVHLLVSTSGWTATTLSVDRSWYPLPLAMGTGLVAVLFFPEWHYDVLGLASIVGSLGAASRSWHTPARTDP